MQCPLLFVSAGDEVEPANGIGARTFRKVKWNITTPVLGLEGLEWTEELRKMLGVPEKEKEGIFKNIVATKGSYLLR